MFKINILEPNWYWILVGQCLVVFFFFVHHNLQILKTSVIKLRFTGISWALVINFFLLFFWWGTNYLHIILILTESDATSCLLICWFLFCFFPFELIFFYFLLIIFLCRFIQFCYRIKLQTCFNECLSRMAFVMDFSLDLIFFLSFVLLVSLWT